MSKQMCGIVGYIGPREATEFLVTGLHRLEYRGYDSAGIATIAPGGDFALVKTAGRIHAPRKPASETPAPGTVGIGHTRWATHGNPTNVNAHPHIGGDNTLAVVHNGVIENFQAFKGRLEGEGYVFRSATDTEVIAHLIDSCFQRQPPMADMEALDYRAVGHRGSGGVGAATGHLRPGDSVSRLARRDDCSPARAVRWLWAWGPASISSPATPRRWPAIPTRSSIWPNTSWPSSRPTICG